MPSSSSAARITLTTLSSHDVIDVVVDVAYPVNGSAANDQKQCDQQAEACGQLGADFPRAKMLTWRPPFFCKHMLRPDAADSGKSQNLKWSLFGFARELD